MEIEIAIIEENTLAAMGLHEILKGMLPNVTIRTFNSFERLIDDTPDMYKHYFVSANIYMDHIQFFTSRKFKTIVLSEGERPTLQGIPHLNVCQTPRNLCESIFKLKEYGHQQIAHKVTTSRQYDDVTNILSKREIDVLRLIIKGYINKEIANKLFISLTTVITHRKNLTEKLGIKSVPELTIYAIAHGIISMDEI